MTDEERGGPVEGAPDDTGDSSGRSEERGDVAEPDAPTTIEENESMSTVLDAGPFDGVQPSSDDV
jgi:hypothetical protein